MLNTLKKVFPYTVPVLFGYLALGFAFGLMLSEIGYNPLWAFLMSLIIFAGSGQFLCVELLAVGASLTQVALLTLILNFRHFFYGLSMISKYKKVSLSKRWYLIFGLTDETYALLSTTKTPANIKEKDFLFLVTLMHHIYWIAGGVIGCTAGSFLPFSLEGVDFTMTALFAVLVVEQWYAHKDHRPALIGFATTIVALIILGPDNFLIPALIIISGILLIMQKRLGKEEEVQL